MKTKICEVCGKEFETDAWNARYCSKTCLRVVERKRARERKKLYSGGRSDLLKEHVRSTTSEVARIAKIASELGLSYGEYVGRFKP